jgi:hypothetical protein
MKSFLDLLGTMMGPAGARVWERLGARRLGRSSDGFEPGFCARLMLKDLRLSQSVRATCASQPQSTTLSLYVAPMSHSEAVERSNTVSGPLPHHRPFCG